MYRFTISLGIGNAVTPYDVNWQRIKIVLKMLLSHPGLQPSIKALIELGMEAIIVMLGRRLYSGHTLRSCQLLLVPFVIYRHTEEDAGKTSAQGCICQEAVKVESSSKNNRLS
jgi:hypothetical protein